MIVYKEEFGPKNLSNFLHRMTTPPFSERQSYRLAIDQSQINYANPA